MKYVKKPDRIYHDVKTGRTMEHRGLSTRISNPDLVEARAKKVSETKRRNYKEAAAL